jgi:hypothetical protein
MAQMLGPTMKQLMGQNNFFYFPCFWKVNNKLQGYACQKLKNVKNQPTLIYNCTYYISRRRGMGILAWYVLASRFLQAILFA